MFDCIYSLGFVFSIDLDLVYEMKTPWVENQSDHYSWAGHCLKQEHMGKVIKVLRLKTKWK